jgi:hypothetical protein
MLTTEQRFWQKVKKASGCWLWLASKRAKGYGAFAYHRGGVLVQDRAHRYSWELHNGPIPDGLCVLHNCPTGDNPACVNPAHLFLGTKAANNADMVSKGRHVPGGTYTSGRYKRGEKHHAARLSADDVRAIRCARLAGYSFGSISNRYGIAVGHIFRIVTRKAWKHVL